MKRNEDRERAMVAIFTRYRDRCATIREQYPEPWQRQAGYQVALSTALTDMYVVTRPTWKPEPGEQSANQ